MLLIAGGEHLSLDGDLLTGAMIDALPGFLTGSEAGTMQQKALRSAINGFLPMLLGMIHRDIVQRGLPIAPPDLRSAEARANLIRYAVTYLMHNFVQLSENRVFVLDGEYVDDVFRVSGISASASGLVDAQDDHAGRDAAYAV